MKVAIITDQHFGFKKGSKHFHSYFKKFYENIFFPTLEKRGITTVIDMGDTFDSRKGIDLYSLDWSQRNYFDRLRDMGCKLTSIVGNHTAFYKNTNDINTIDLLLREYDNIDVIVNTEERTFDNLKVLFVPWITSDDSERTYATIKDLLPKSVWVTSNSMDSLHIMDIQWKMVTMLSLSKNLLKLFLVITILAPQMVLYLI